MHAVSNRELSCELQFDGPRKRKERVLPVPERDSAVVPDQRSDRIDCPVPALGKECRPVRRPLLVRMLARTRSSLAWDRGREQDHVSGSAQVVHQRRCPARGEMLRNLHADCETEPSSNVKPTFEVKSTKVLARDDELARSAVDAENIIDPMLSCNAQPDARAATHVKDRRRRHQVDDDRQERPRAVDCSLLLPGVVPLPVCGGRGLRPHSRDRDAACVRRGRAGKRPRCRP